MTAKVRKLIGGVKCIFCGASAVYRVLTRGKTVVFVCEEDFKRIPSFVVLEVERVVGAGKTGKK